MGRVGQEAPALAPKQPNLIKYKGGEKNHHEMNNVLGLGLGKVLGSPPLGMFHRTGPE